MKKTILSLALALSLFCTTAVAAGYTDVPTTHTFYTEITQAVSAGYFNGTSATTYNPGGTISNQQFLVVISRVLGLTDSSEFDVEDTILKLTQKGILDGNENFLNSQTYGTAMTRESMAYIMAHVLEYTGEELNENIDEKRIPDYADIGNTYLDEVVTVYSNGILMGTDTEGTFNPKGNLTRGAAAAVIMRLVEASNRSEVLSDAEYYAEQAAELSATSIIIYEGETRYNSRLAQAGDIVIKADGTQVVLVEGEHGIVGENQDVSADLGLYCSTSGSTVIANSNVAWGGQGFGTTGSGDNAMSQYYQVNNLTGEGHWSSDWSVMTSKPSYDGTTAYELSEDQNWIWLSQYGDWAFVPGTDYTWDLLNAYFASH